MPPPSRDVTPPGVTPAPVGPGPLVREPMPPPPPDAPRWHRFILPATTDAATFVVPNRKIRIAGVVAPPQSATCHSSVIGEWPCGDVALAALRHFLLGRPVQCSFLSADRSDPLVAPCRVGKTDLGSWLLAQGWAKAADDASEDYRRAADSARCTGRGLWHDGTPRLDCPAVKARPQQD